MARTARAYQPLTSMHSPSPAPESASASQPIELAQWQLTQRPQHFVEGRSVGGIAMYEISQPPGSYPDPPAQAHLLQLIRRPASGWLAFGGQYLAGHFLTGEMVLAPADTGCDYEFDDHSHVIAVPVPLALVQSVASDLRLPGCSDLGALHSVRLAAAEIRQLMLALWAAGKAADTAATLLGQQLLSSLAARLLHLSGHPSAAARRQHALAPSRLQRVLAYVEAGLTEGVSLQAMADIAQVSPHHFLRSFKQDIGETPYQYVCRRRVERAVDLLRLSDQPIADIALTCGYASHQHMCAAMARWRGRSPRDFQRHWPC